MSTHNSTALKYLGKGGWIEAFIGIFTEIKIFGYLMSFAAEFWEPVNENKIWKW